MFQAARLKNYRYLACLPPSQMNKVNEDGSTILHLAAKTGDVDFLFACICLGVRQDTRDRSSNTFQSFTTGAMKRRLTLLYNAWKAGKINCLRFKSEYDCYHPYHYFPDGQPMVSALLSKVPLDISACDKIFESGTDFSKIKNLPTNLEKDWTVPELNFEKANFTVQIVDQAELNLPLSIVTISDVHWEHKKLHLPYADILICSGDLCMPWHKDITEFIDWFTEQPHQHKLLIAGNHDGIIQRDLTRYRQLFADKGIVYLQDSGIEISGIKFWGIPWTPFRPRNKNNAFTKSRRELKAHWEQIPDDTNVLITHGPPYGIGELNSEYFKSLPYQAGDYTLRQTISRLKNLKLHVFGHQHFGRGLYKGSNGTYFVNCAIAMDHQPFFFPAINCDNK